MMTVVRMLHTICCRCCDMHVMCFFCVVRVFRVFPDVSRCFLGLMVCLGCSWPWNCSPLPTSSAETCVGTSVSPDRPDLFENLSNPTFVYTLLLLIIYH